MSENSFYFAQMQNLHSSIDDLTYFLQPDNKKDKAFMALLLKRIVHPCIILTNKDYRIISDSFGEIYDVLNECYLKLEELYAKYCEEKSNEKS